MFLVSSSKHYVVYLDHILQNSLKISIAILQGNPHWCNEREEPTKWKSDPNNPPVCQAQSHKIFPLWFQLHPKMTCRPYYDHPSQTCFPTFWQLLVPSYRHPILLLPFNLICIALHIIKTNLQCKTIILTARSPNTFHKTNLEVIKIKMIVHEY